MTSFDDQLALCDKGDEIVYHRGFHCMSLLSDTKRNSEAQAAWNAYLRGDVVLYQRRIGPDELEYCAKALR